MARVLRRRGASEEAPEPADVTAEADAITTGATPDAAEPTADELRSAGPPPIRVALIAGTAVIAAAVMSGGIFVGAGARVWAAVAGILGIVLGMRAARIRRPLYLYIAVIGGLILIALLVTLPAGFSQVLDVSRNVREAARLGDLARPPVDFTPGWRPILGLLMAMTGFASAWAGLEMRRPSFALALPIPIIGIAAISVPESQQVANGLVALGLFGAGLGVLSGTETEGGRRTSIAYEVRRAMRAIPLIGVITLVMYFLAQTNFLFPAPLYDPAQEAQKPKAVPLTDVEDRVLFKVDSELTGPWRMGTLDVYDGTDWRLPPFARTRFVDVPRSGVVDDDLPPGVRAEIEIAGLTGAVVPGLSNLVGVVAEGPRVVFDQRSQNIRLKQGQMRAGLQYTLIASKLPSVQNLRAVPTNVPNDITQYAEIPEPPPVLQAIIDQFGADTNNRWDHFFALHRKLLNTAIAEGAGTPVSVTPDRVEKILTVTPEATPFEIVAADAMLARWVGIPARIGYGFDGGDSVEGNLEVFPRHGATWIEVYFPGYKWIPVIGKPQVAKTSLADAQQQQTQLDASEDISVQLFFPTLIPPASQLLERVRNAVAVALPILLVLVILYYVWPAIRKAYRRNRRRTWALSAGPAARVMVAYAEWRDLATDYGFAHSSDTPLMFLNRVVPDEEHSELAWLVTRALWGDLRHDVTEADAVAAEELSRSLRKRLSQTQSWVMRVVAGVSRLSMRNPYGVGLGGAEQREVIEIAA
jgi:hypothetical protein